MPLWCDMTVNARNAENKNPYACESCWSLSLPIEHDTGCSPSLRNTQRWKVADTLNVPTAYASLPRYCLSGE